jgi:hypothetical protein
LILVLALGFGLVLTAVLLAKVGYRDGFQAADLGCMSHQWVAAHNASQPSSSM